MSKPHVVLTPGAWHTPQCFELIIPKLEKAGYTVHTAQLPAVGSDNPPQDLSQDVAKVQELVTRAIGDGNDVVVVPHSWSGVVVSSALEGFGKKQREAKGQKGGVIKLAYMCAFLVPEGVSLMDAIQGNIGPWWEVQASCTYSVVVDPSVFYQDLPPADQEKYAAMIKKHSFGTKKAKSTGAAWREIPLTYLICEDDLAIPLFAQELMTNAVKDMGGEIETERLKSSHSPFLSHPNYVVDWIRRAAGEKL
ncbi:alpha/beta-hydrolase [Polyplosphaeria fusca]|uniref:Alpha/beta-hydrolase n=1 Tax=Polyplosphaeria fusca TaxID=682080 RepID=A0A9P4R4H9_9PLEO|nr:alpha/beta-hydrolase [Polyplosphaeria fusca]